MLSIFEAIAQQSSLGLFDQIAPFESAEPCQCIVRRNVPQTYHERRYGRDRLDGEIAEIVVQNCNVPSKAGSAYKLHSTWYVTTYSLGAFRCAAHSSTETLPGRILPSSDCWRSAHVVFVSASSFSTSAARMPLFCRCLGKTREHSPF